MKSFVVCWAVCSAAAAASGAEPPRAAPQRPAGGEDIAWVWDHQAPPLRARAWAVTVTQLQLQGEGLHERARLRRLPPPEGRAVTPVVHVEQAPRATPGPLTPAQLSGIARRVHDAAATSTSGWVQLDFEARPSQRDSYHALVRQIRQDLPPRLRLSVTLLAWQCRSAAWIAPLAADELVPMFFRLGAQREAWMAMARDGGARLQPRCRAAAGFAPDALAPGQPPSWQRQWPRRYWFNLRPGRATAWDPDLESSLWPSP